MFLLLMKSIRSGTTPDFDSVDIAHLSVDMKVVVAAEFDPERRHVKLEVAVDRCFGRDEALECRKNLDQRRVWPTESLVVVSERGS